MSYWSVFLYLLTSLVFCSLCWLCCFEVLCDHVFTFHYASCLTHSGSKRDLTASAELVLRHHFSDLFISMVHSGRNRSSASTEAVIGCPLTILADHCLALPLRPDTSDPDTTTTLLRVQGTAYGALSGSAPFCVSVLQVDRTFHEENWSCFTFNGGCRDVWPLIVPSVPTIYSGDFTDVWHLRDDVWAICPEMQAFRLRLYDRSGTDYFLVSPFQPSQYHISVHPNAALVFTTTFHQTLLLQAIVHGCHLYTASPRYWLGPGHTMILEEWGRWRSQYGLEWIAKYGFSRVPICIVSEMMHLCQEAGVLHMGDA